MNKKEAAVIGAFTGVLLGDFSDLHKYVDEKFERPVFTHEMGSLEFAEDLKNKSREDFMEVCRNISDN